MTHSGWTDEKAEECIRFGMRDKKFNLKHAQEKSDIQKTWGDDMMPMKLCMLGRKVYSDVPFPLVGDQMATCMVVEAGLMHGAHVDWRRMFRG